MNKNVLIAAINIFTNLQYILEQDRPLIKRDD